MMLPLLRLTRRVMSQPLLRLDGCAMRLTLLRLDGCVTSPSLFLSSLPPEASPLTPSRWLRACINGGGHATAMVQCLHEWRRSCHCDGSVPASGMGTVLGKKNRLISSLTRNHPSWAVLTIGGACPIGEDHSDMASSSRISRVSALLQHPLTASLTPSPIISSTSLAYLLNASTSWSRQGKGGHVTNPSSSMER
jgi:hypothetical protein